MARLLLSNDDGIQSEGLSALADVLSSLGEVLIVAPEREKSASSHSLTMHRPLRMKRLGERVYAVDGTPTDCILLGVHRLFDKDAPDLVVSGINKGGNLGDDIFYSGTVSAAMEGARLGIPSFAVSLVAREGFIFSTAAEVALKLGRWMLENGKKRPMLLNVNVPNLPSDRIKGFRVTRQGKSIYNGSITESCDPRGEVCYWIGGEEPGYEARGDSDFEAVVEGFVSVTPLKLDLTDEKAVEELRSRRFWEEVDT